MAKSFDLPVRVKVVMGLINRGIFSAVGIVMLFVLSLSDASDHPVPYHPPHPSLALPAGSPPLCYVVISFCASALISCRDALPAMHQLALYSPVLLIVLTGGHAWRAD